MFILNDRFPSGMKISQIPLTWYRKVTAFLNSICAGTGIRIDAPASPEGERPVTIGIDPDYLKDKLADYATKKELNDLDARLRLGNVWEGGSMGAPSEAEGEDTTESGAASPTLAADDDSADFTAGGDTLSDGDAIDTTNHPDAENDTTRWMNNAAANALGSYDADNDTPSGAWLTPTTLEALDPFDPNAQTGDEVVFNHHKALNLLLFTRSKKEGADKLFFARFAQIDATGRLRYGGAEICIARTLDGSRTDEFLSILVGESGAENSIIDAADTTTTLQDITPTPVQDYPFPDAQNAIQGVVWRAGHGVGYEEAVVTRMKPYTASRTIYVEIGFRVRRYSANGALYEVANEQAWGYVLQAT